MGERRGVKGSVCSVCKQRVEPGEEICKNCKTVSIWRVCCRCGL